MNYKELTAEEISDFIINDPKLIYVGFPDEELVYMHENNKYKPHFGTYYIGITENEELLGILKWEYFSPICISAHLYLSSKYHHTGMSQKIYAYIKEKLLEQEHIEHVIAFVPKLCKHVYYSLTKFGFKREGTIKNSIRWRKKLTDVYILGLNLR